MKAIKLWILAPILYVAMDVASLVGAGRAYQAIARAYWKVTSLSG